MPCLQGFWKRHCNLFGGSTVPPHSKDSKFSFKKFLKTEIILRKKCGLLAKGILTSKDSWKCLRCHFRDNQAFQLSDLRPTRSVNPTSAINLTCCKSPELRRTSFLAGNALPFAGAFLQGFSSTKEHLILFRTFGKRLPCGTASNPSLWTSEDLQRDLRLN